mmetsp:Transcript_51128/g.91848  ORF Transcript_51128/g.91848 Transcript_51128/m.91848 type:complete len:538 (+) Transcript_51128:127-1740(+)
MHFIQQVGASTRGSIDFGAKELAPKGASPAFKELIAALCEQYERDIAEARSQQASGTRGHGEVEKGKEPPKGKENRTNGAHFARIVPEEAENQASDKPFQSEEPLLSRFAKSGLFDKLSAGLLISNALFIGVQVDFGFQPEMPAVLDTLDIVFNVLFLIELFIRLGGYGCREFWCNEQLRAWHAFDFVVVLLSSIDTGISLALSGQNTPLGNVSILRIIRIVRIVRVLRIIRVLKFFRDLRILIASLANTIKTVSFALILLLLGMYMFAVALTQLVADHVNEQSALGKPIAADDDMLFFFGSVGHTIFALFMTTAGGIDWKDAAVPLITVGNMAISIYIAFVVIMLMCVMNVLTGIFCQAAIETAASDRENMMHTQLEETKEYVEVLKTLFLSWDDTGDGKCNIDEFVRHIQDEATIALLKTLEIDARDALALFELLDSNGSGEIDLEEFITGCITLRGGAKAVHMEKAIAMNQKLCRSLEAIETKLKFLLAAKDQEIEMKLADICNDPALMAETQKKAEDDADAEDTLIRRGSMLD